MRVVSAFMAILPLLLYLAEWITKSWQRGRCLGGSGFAFRVLITSLVFKGIIKVPPCIMLVIYDGMNAAKVFFLLSSTLFGHIDRAGVEE
jgi:hypothetical protein